ncbi:wax ester/triacylglycerol synthase domain-containing protein [Streptomyces sp. NPDC054796]
MPRTAPSPVSDAALATDVLTRTFLRLEQHAPDPSDMYFGFLLRMPGTAPSLAALRRHIAPRLAALPALTHRLFLDGDQVRWQPAPDFDLAHHVRTLPPASAAPLTAQALLAPGPDASRPRWRLWLRPGPTTGSGWALYYLAHHAVHDATAMLHTLRVLLDDTTPPPPPPPLATEPAASRRRGPLFFLLPDVLRTYRPAPPCGPRAGSGPARHVLAHDSVDVAALRETARSAGVTANQVHLAAMGPALASWPRFSPARTRPRSWRRPAWALVPVEFRSRGPLEPQPRGGNRFGLVRLPLPSGLPRSARHLRTATSHARRQRINRRKEALRSLLEGAPGRIADWLLARVTDPRRSALTVSNMHVSRPMSALGAPVEEIVAIPWLPPGHTCFSLLVSYNGKATLSVLTRSATPHPRHLTAGWTRAVGALRSLERSVSPAATSGSVLCARPATTTASGPGPSLGLGLGGGERDGAPRDSGGR